MIVLSVSGGNDSVAMMEWAHERGLSCVAAYCNTGWAGVGWPQRIERVAAWWRSLGHEFVEIRSKGMAALVRERKGFPGNGMQFCTTELKILPFLDWIDGVDPEGQATVCIGKRRVESEDRKGTPEYIDSSEVHGGRKVWHPLYLHTDAERNALIARAGFEVLPHRSRECEPCVNANRATFLRLTPGEVERVSDLEVEVGKPMFRPKRFGAVGIHGVIVWAKDGRKRASVEDEEAQCASLFGCGV